VVFSPLCLGNEPFRQPIVKIQIKCVAVAAQRRDPADELVNHSFTDLIAAQVDQLIQRALNFRPPQLELLRSRHCCRSPRQLRFGCFQFSVQPGTAGTVFLFGNIPVCPHIHKVGDAPLYALELRGNMGAVNSNGLIRSIALAYHFAGKPNRLFALAPKLFQEHFRHGFQLPIGDHVHVAVAGIVHARLPPLPRRAVVELVVAFVTV